jgi:hypothetical protein
MKNEDKPGWDVLVLCYLATHRAEASDVPLLNV